MECIEIIPTHRPDHHNDPYLEELDLIIYAFRDQARLYRRLRRDVEAGLIHHYTIDECTEKMKEAESHALRYETLLASETN